MKKALFLILFLLGLNTQAQITVPPQGINYQAVAIDADGKEIVGVDLNGQPVSERAIRVRFSIIKDAANGLLDYREEHTTNTDANGLFNLVIGQGVADIGLFEDIDWGTGFHFLKVELDIKGGNQFKDMGTQQLWSVPYALYAEEAGNGIASVSDNGDGTLTFTYTNGSTYTTSPLTSLTGPQGPAGPQGVPGVSGSNGTNGVGITSTIDNGDGTFTINYSDGSSFTTADFTGSQGLQGPVGPQGLQGLSGTNGTNGVGITSTTDNGNGTFTLNYSDGSSFTTANLTGPQGPQGVQGVSGTNGTDGVGIISTIDNGDGTFTLNYSDGSTFTTSNLTGPQGTTGATGPQGVQGVSGTTGANGVGITATIDNGDGTFTLNYSDGTTFTTSNLTGPQGLPGSLDAWSLTGNAGTSSNTNFIGTTDDQDWVVKTNNSERMRVSSNGNIGLGLTIPTSQLHVLGTITSQTTASNNIFRQINDNNSILRYSERLNIIGTNTQIDFDPFSGDASGNLTYRFFRHSNTSGSKLIQFLRGNGTTQGSAQIGIDGADSYFQLQGGNFGIGNSNPLDKLHLTGGGIRIDGSYGVGFNSCPPYDTTHNEGARIYWKELPSFGPQKDYFVFEKTDANQVDPDGGFLFVNTGSDDIKSYSMMINGNGNVGIGTINPQAKLVINSDSGVGSGVDSSIVFTNVGNVGIGISSPLYKLEIGTSDNFNWASRMQNTGGSGYGLLVSSGAPTSNVPVFEIQNNANAVLFSARSNGNIGIGTTTPARKLHVNSVMRLEPIPTAPTSPAKGDMYFDSTLNKLRVYDGTAWQNCW
jgi:hypothetical protein